METELTPCMICKLIQPIATGFKMCDSCKATLRAEAEKELRLEVEAKMKLELEAKREAEKVEREAKKTLDVAIRDRLRLARANYGHSSHTWALSKQAHRFDALNRRIVSEVKSVIPTKDNSEYWDIQWAFGVN